VIPISSTSRTVESDSCARRRNQGSEQTAVVASERLLQPRVANPLTDEENTSMRLLIPICAVTAVMSIGVAAQDSTVKSTTAVKTDDASVISLTGCLSQDKATGS